MPAIEVVAKGFRFGENLEVPARLPALVLILAAALLLLSCRRVVDTSVEGDLHRPIFRFRVATNVFDPEKPCLNVVWVAGHRVAEDPPGATVHVLWEVRRRAPCVELNQVTYGVTPPGFEEVRSPQPLNAGNPYTLSVGEGRMGGDCTFVWNGRRFEERAETCNWKSWPQRSE
jgi:hypothetical protein